MSVGNLRAGSLLLLAALGTACGGTSPQAVSEGASLRRQQIFPATVENPLRQALTTPSRLHVVFWPKTDGCLLCSRPAVEALDQVARRFPDTQILTVVSEGADFPSQVSGTRVSLSPRAYRDQVRLTPVPRIEVWSHEGKLLLLKSLTEEIAAGQALVLDIERARSFTSPLTGETAR